MVAFFGMGLLGANFVRALLRRGSTVRVWNRSVGRTEELVSRGAQAFASSVEAVQGAQRLHLTLKDDASVDEVLEAARPGFAPGLIIIDHTTTSVEGARQRARRWADRGFGYLHAPVFMGPQNAHDATGIMLASGDKTLFGRVQAELTAMTGTLQFYGEDPGKAAAIKLMGNLLFLTTVAGLRDLLTLARSVGASNEEVTQLVSALGGNSLLPTRLNRILTADHSLPSWELSMARKDAGLMIDEAQNAGHTLSVIPGLAQVMDQAISQGAGQQDWTVITKEVR